MNPLHSIIRKVVARMGWPYAFPRRGKVVDQTGDTFTVSLDDAKNMEPLRQVPLATALPGVSVQLSPGAQVVVMYTDLAADSPVAFLVSGQALALTLDVAGPMRLGPSSGDIRLGPGSVLPVPGTYRPIVAAGDTTANVVNGAPAAITGVAPSVIANGVVKV